MKDSFFLFFDRASVCAGQLIISAFVRNVVQVSISQIFIAFPVDTSFFILFSKRTFNFRLAVSRKYFRPVTIIIYLYAIRRLFVLTFTVPLYFTIFSLREFSFFFFFYRLSSFYISVAERLPRLQRER